MEIITGLLSAIVVFLCLYYILEKIEFCKRREDE